MTRPDATLSHLVKMLHLAVRPAQSMSTVVINLVGSRFTKYSKMSNLVMLLQQKQFAQPSFVHEAKVYETLRARL